MVTERARPDTVFMPFHLGRWQGADMLAYHPTGAAPRARRESINIGDDLWLHTVSADDARKPKRRIRNVKRAQDAEIKKWQWMKFVCDAEQLHRMQTAASQFCK
jgi:hypothetical protein